MLLAQILSLPFPFYCGFHPVFPFPCLFFVSVDEREGFFSCSVYELKEKVLLA